MSGLLSDLLTASIAKHARTLTQNNYFNGHPDLVVLSRNQESKIDQNKKPSKSAASHCLSEK